MPRPKRIRKMDRPPLIKGFRPFGSPAVLSERVILLYEEYESVRLTDYERMSQAEAADRMQISRPTFTRIYDRARQKIATAFAESRSIVIEGGNVDFSQQWYRCLSCENTFHAGHHNALESCPVCGKNELYHINGSMGGQVQQEDAGCHVEGKLPYCICPSCGMRLSHQPGVPCRSVSCPQCGESMKRDHLI